MSTWAQDADDGQLEYAKVLLGRLAMQEESWRMRSLWHSLAAEAAEELDRRRAVVRQLHESTGVAGFFFDDTPPDAA